MRRYLLDSNAVGDFINRRAGVADRVRDARRRGDKLGTIPPVIGELHFGVEYSDTRDPNLARLRHGLARLICWPYGPVAAVEYGRLAAHLRRTGRPMQQVDIMVAAVALTLGNCTVVSTDTDLRAVPGLDVEDWSA